MRRALLALGSVVCVLAIVALVAVLRPMQSSLRVSRKLEYTCSFSEACLIGVSVCRNGVAYTLREAQGKHVCEAYSRAGKLIWRIEIEGRINTKCERAFVALPGDMRTQLADYRCTGDRGYLWVTVKPNGAIGSNVLQLSPESSVALYHAVRTPDGIRAVGDSGYGYAVAAGFDSLGRKRWSRCETLTGPYDVAASDSRGWMVASNTFDIVAYAPDGRLLWQVRPTARVGDRVVWLGFGRHDEIIALAVIKTMIPLTSHAEVELFRRRGSDAVTATDRGGYDESGRDQDYVLMRLDRRGRMLSKGTVSHGAWLYICDATVNARGQIYFLGNRHDVNRFGFPIRLDHAQMIKCNDSGQLLWSGMVRLPKGCVATGTTLDAKGGVYVFGDSRAPGERAPSSKSRWFLYKVVEPR